jgi:hypothetical protein
MKVNTLAPALVAVLALPAAAYTGPASAQETRYYGVDSHTSFSTACAVTVEENRSVQKSFMIDGSNCGDASAHFEVQFLTGKVTADSSGNLQAQEDNWLGKVAAAMTPSAPNITNTSNDGPKDARLDGVWGRIEHVTFTGQGARPWIEVFADSPDSQTIYFTGVAIIENTDDPQLETTTQTAVDEFLNTIKIAGGTG